MNSQSKKMVALFVALAVGGGLVGLAAYPMEVNEASAIGSETQEPYLNDPNLARQSHLGLNNGQLFLKMMGSVVLVITLAAVTLHLSKKVLPRVTKATGREIRVMETAYLGPRKALHLVEIGNQKLLIGSTNDHIATLAHLGQPWLDLSQQETVQVVSP